MTLLELMTLKNSFECYSLNLKNPKILENIIEERLIEASNNGYSEDLISIVKNMLQKDENYRVSFSDILVIIYFIFRISKVKINQDN